MSGVGLEAALSGGPAQCLLVAPGGPGISGERVATCLCPQTVLQLQSATCRNWPCGGITCLPQHSNQGAKSGQPLQAGIGICTCCSKLARCRKFAKQLYSTWLARRQAESNCLLKLCILHISCFHQVLLLLLLQQDIGSRDAVWQVTLPDRVCQMTPSAAVAQTWYHRSCLWPELLLGLHAPKVTAVSRPALNGS